MRDLPLQSSASGRQIELTCGEQRAVVTEVGGGIREYSVGGEPLIAGYGEAESCSGGRGQVLIPWPNRLPGGRWQWQGKDLQLPLDELPLGIAMHGLTRWLRWAPVTITPVSCTLVCRLHPRPGWPGTLDCAIKYSLGASGLDVTTTVQNAGGEACPVAIGMHPYLATAGEHLVDEAELEVPAETVRPSGWLSSARVSERPDLDFRQLRTIGAQAIDVTYGALRPSGGRTHVRFRSRGRTTRLWLSDDYRWLQVYTADDDPVEGRRRRSLAVEPMTAPPGALATGEDLQVLEPGVSLSASWGVGPQDGEHH